MKVFINPPQSEWPELLSRPVYDPAELEAKVAPVMQAVRDRGDAALKEFTQRFDQVDLERFAVPQDQIASAESLLSEELKQAIQLAEQNIRKFHQAQASPLLKVETMPGVSCWRRSLPIEKVGLYIPGGSAPLFSTILMLGIPASIAGCKQIILCTPPGKDQQVHPAILYTASLLGIKQVFQVGGAQAIAAMAYGTEQIPQVDKIFGPGNQYVTIAKQLAAKEGMAIDMPAGPSELAVVADETAIPAFVAADLLSQAEHGPDSQVLLITDSTAMVEAVQEALDRQLALLPRQGIAEQALAHSRAFVMADRTSMVSLINAYAPEHLILAVDRDEEMALQITHAGSVFLGNYTPESVGDYASGTNHTLPTNGFARAYSGVSLDSFVKKITYQKLSREGLQNLGPAVENMAQAEELEAHKRAVSIRLATLKEKES
ncbi:MAG: histidinol dehydrogenase [Bacteroidota bacterium]